MIRGIDGSLRGTHFKQHRPQLVLLDDLLKDDTARSETKREQVKNTFTDVVIPIGTKDTNILVVGTVLHEEDLMADLLKGKIPGVRSIKKSAVICFAERDDLWSDWEAKYNNLQDLDKIETAKSFFYNHQDEMLEGTEILLFNPGNIRYNNQVKDYNKGAKHDDAPDSLYGAVQLVEGVKSIRFFDRSLLF
ncbi:MAG: hypothetical protein ACYDEJ_17160 [Desulfitobacteriaceae bacterium]